MPNRLFDELGYQRIGACVALMHGDRPVYVRDRLLMDMQCAFDRADHAFRIGSRTMHDDAVHDYHAVRREWIVVVEHVPRSMN